jgi:uncharacterized cupredoxin-like copper-binding protein
MIPTYSFSPRGPLFRTAAVFGLATVLVACGGSESNPSDTSETTASTAPDTIEITMTDYGYSPSDVTVPAGQEVTLQLTNDGSVEHYFVVGDTIASSQDGFQQNLFSGVSLTKNKQTEGHAEEEEEEHEEEEGGHENVFELPPGGSGSMTFTLPASKAGTYAIACFETTGGQKHYQMGMEGTLTVTASGQ